MEQLKHEDELRSFDEVPLDPVEVDDAELELAVKIIEQRVNDVFEPEKYEDVVRSRMMELIQQKIDGHEIAVPAEEHAEAKIVDLMEALKASVGNNSVGNKKKAAGRKKAAPRKSAARAARKASPTKAKSTSRSKAR